MLTALELQFVDRELNAVVDVDFLDFKACLFLYKSEVWRDGLETLFLVFDGNVPVVTRERVNEMDGVVLVPYPCGFWGMEST